MSVTALELAKKLQEEQESLNRAAAQHFGVIDDGHFAAVAINDKKFVLAPYPEFTMSIYRGQNKYYEPCLPSLYRTSTSKIERLIERIRVAEFQILLFDHPAVVGFSDFSIMGLTLKTDYEGLAQHYGLKTELIDFTSNPFVAAFFACCEYDNNSQKYRPIMKAGQKGIIYSYLAAADMAGLCSPRTSIVGLQPLSRPAEQYAWCYRLPKRASLNSRPFFSSFQFVHDPRVSIKIFDTFEGGKKLFPYDPISEKALKIASMKKLSRSAFDLAITRYEQRMREQSTLNDLSRKGVSIVDDRETVFTEAEKAKAEKEWIERRSDLVSRIHWRRVCYPE